MQLNYENAELYITIIFVFFTGPRQPDQVAIAQK